MKIAAKKARPALRVWVKPAVKRISAGAAENNNVTTPDGGLGTALS